MTFNPKFLVFPKIFCYFFKTTQSRQNKKKIFVTVHLLQTCVVTLIKRFLFKDQEKIRKNLFFSKAFLKFLVNFLKKACFSN